MSDQRDDAPEPQHDPLVRPGPRAWYLVVPVAALVVGLVLGGLVVGVTMDGDDDAEDRDREPNSAPTSGDGTTVIIPDACLDVADTVGQITDTLRDGLGAVREFQADRILALLNELEDLEAEARLEAAACEDTSVSDGSVTRTPTPEPKPTSVPTQTGSPNPS